MSERRPATDVTHADAGDGDGGVAFDTPRPLAGGVRGEGAAPNRRPLLASPPPTTPLPQGDGEYQIQTPTQPHHPHRLLRLLAWLSPAFPTGAYAYSHG